MAALEINEEQIAALIQQLSAEQRERVLFALARQPAEEVEARRQKAQAELRRIAAERGQDWDTMSDEERQDLVDDLLHEHLS